MAAIVLKSTFTVDETLETFDQDAQDAFKLAFANMLAPAGSDLEGGASALSVAALGGARTCAGVATVAAVHLATVAVCVRQDALWAY